MSSSVETRAVAAEGPARIDPPGRSSRLAKSGTSDGVRTLIVNASRLAIIVVVVAIWEWLPDVGWIREIAPFMDHFYISSPSEIVSRAIDVTTGRNDTGVIWPFFVSTMETALLGTLIAIVGGALLGLLLSNNKMAADIVRPFIVAANAVPRIAIVPVIILITGSSTKADVITAVSAAITAVFFNAFEGGCSVPREMVQNAVTLGARPFTVMRRVRLPYVLAWTFAAIPNAVALGLVGAVTAEVFSGAGGLGQVLTTALNTTDATLTFTVVVILTIAGVVLVIGTDLLRKLVVPWWDAQR